MNALSLGYLATGLGAGMSVIGVGIGIGKLAAAHGREDRLTWLATP